MLGAPAGHPPRRVAGGFGLGGAIFRLLLAARLLGLHVEQALPVGDGDLVVVGMDLAEGEEAVPVAAVFDEGGLQAGLYPDHLGEVDVALELPLVDVSTSKSSSRLPSSTTTRVSSACVASISMRLVI